MLPYFVIWVGLGVELLEDVEPAMAQRMIDNNLLADLTLLDDLQSKLPSKVQLVSTMAAQARSYELPLKSVWSEFRLLYNRVARVSSDEFKRTHEEVLTAHRDLLDNCAATVLMAVRAHWKVSSSSVFQERA
jgi:hypothetical protein